jgi:pyruvate dehydrogenase E2 component (dihydrolipoamide acetyltransferase)
MATLFRMPGVSADADEAVLEAWTVQQGATISSGQTIASVETEKAVVDVESDIDAVVHALLVPGGATVPVGDPIAVLLEIDEDPAEGEKLLRLRMPRLRRRPSSPRRPPAATAAGCSPARSPESWPARRVSTSRR